MPAGSELNERLGRTDDDACEHAAAVVFGMGGKSGRTARGEGKDWALPVRGERPMGDATGFQEYDVRKSSRSWKSAVRRRSNAPT